MDEFFVKAMLGTVTVAFLFFLFVLIKNIVGIMRKDFLEIQSPKVPKTNSELNFLYFAYPSEVLDFVLKKKGKIEIVSISFRNNQDGYEVWYYNL